MPQSKMVKGKGAIPLFLTGTNPMTVGYTVEDVYHSLYYYREREREVIQPQPQPTTRRKCGSLSSLLLIRNPESLCDTHNIIG